MRSNLSQLWSGIGLSIGLWKVYNGIDRIDNSIGYLEPNCSPCCGMCNYAKKHIPLQDFVDYIRRVSSYVSSGKLDEYLKTLSR
jgi:hypothetical protein